MTTNENSTNDAETSDFPARTTIEDVRRVTCEQFDERTWEVLEAELATLATLLIEDVDACTGLIVVGPSSSGKTTALSFLEGLDELIYRSDDVTPRSFVSHDASKTEDQLRKVDLLPKIAQKTLLVRDLSTWFAGEQDEVYGRMATMTTLMDGRGYTRDSGSHGGRGYTGSEYRFNFIGASTPLQPRAWAAMGNAGSRFVFHEKRGTSDIEGVVDAVLNGTSYPEKVRRVREAVTAFVTQLWTDTGGVGSVPMEPRRDPDIGVVLGYLAEVIRHARAQQSAGSVHRENAFRLVSMLNTLAQGRALLYGRRYIEVDDLNLCARIALSTMPEKRRAGIRAVLDPANGGTLTAADMEAAAGVSRPTAIDRMDQLAALGFGGCAGADEDGRGTKSLVLGEAFVWPQSLTFPAF
jgi:hypothetical protein